MRADAATPSLVASLVAAAATSRQAARSVTAAVIVANAYSWGGWGEGRLGTRGPAVRSTNTSLPAHLLLPCDQCHCDPHARGNGRQPRRDDRLEHDRGDVSGCCGAITSVAQVLHAAAVERTCATELTSFGP